MKLAHHMKKHEGYTMSEALTLAWDKAKRCEFYWIVEKRATNNSVKMDYNRPSYQRMMSDYYSRGNGAYYGD